MKLYNDAKERCYILTIAAAVAAHAIIAGGQCAHTPQGYTELIDRSFSIAEKFLAEAERRAALP